MPTWLQRDAGESAGEQVAGACSARRLIELRLADDVIAAVLMQEIGMTRAEAHRAVAAAADARLVQQPLRQPDQPSSPLRTPQRRRADRNSSREASTA